MPPKPSYISDDLYRELKTNAFAASTERDLWQQSFALNAESSINNLSSILDEPQQQPMQQSQMRAPSMDVEPAPMPPVDTSVLGDEFSDWRSVPKAGEPQQFTPEERYGLPPKLEPMAPVTAPGGAPVAMPQGTAPGAGPSGQPAPAQGGDLRAYTRAKAASLGIDPDVAERVAESEGGFGDPVRQSDVVYRGQREQSYGPFQLNVNGGLGSVALQRGIDPRDPSHVYRAIDFALENAAQGGWGPFHGAARVGVGARQGIGQRPVGPVPAVPTAPAPAGEEQVTYRDQWGNTFTAPRSKFDARPGGNADVTVVSTSRPSQAAPPQQTSGDQAGQPGMSTVSLSGITPPQFGLNDADADAICGPVLAMAFARSNGRNPTIQEAKQMAAENGRWTRAQGMGGPEAMAQTLRSMNIPATYKPGALNIETIRRETQNGNPVGINTDGHYFVVEGVDEQGRLDLGNSAKALRASGGRQWFRPEEIAGLGMGAPTGVIYKDSPNSPTPSVAVRATGMPPAAPTAAGPTAAAPSSPPADSSVSTAAAPGAVWSPDTGTSTPAASQAPVGRNAGGGVQMALPTEQPFDPDQGPRESGYTVNGVQPTSGGAGVSNGTALAVGPEPTPAPTYNDPTSGGTQSQPLPLSVTPTYNDPTATGTQTQPIATETPLVTPGYAPRTQWPGGQPRVAPPDAEILAGQGPVARAIDAADTAIRAAPVQEAASRIAPMPGPVGAAASLVRDYGAASDMGPAVTTQPGDAELFMGPQPVTPTQLGINPLNVMSEGETWRSRVASGAADAISRGIGQDPDTVVVGVTIGGVPIQMTVSDLLENLTDPFLGAGFSVGDMVLDEVGKVALRLAAPYVRGGLRQTIGRLVASEPVQGAVTAGREAVESVGRGARGLAEEGARQLMDLTPSPRMVPEGGGAPIRDVVDRAVTGDWDPATLTEELQAVGAKINDDGTVTVYHRTTPERAQQIQQTGTFIGKEDGVFFSTRPDGQVTGYGDAIVEANVPLHDLTLDDVFGDEAHVRVPTIRAGVPYRGAQIPRSEPPAGPVSRIRGALERNAERMAQADARMAAEGSTLPSYTNAQAAWRAGGYDQMPYPGQAVMSEGLRYESKPVREWMRAGPLEGQSSPLHARALEEAPSLAVQSGRIVADAERHVPDLAVPHAVVDVGDTPSSAIAFPTLGPFRAGSVAQLVADQGQQPVVLRRAIAPGETGNSVQFTIDAVAAPGLRDAQEAVRQFGAELGAEVHWDGRQVRLFFDNLGPDDAEQTVLRFYDGIQSEGINTDAIKVGTSYVERVEPGRAGVQGAAGAATGANGQPHARDADLSRRILAAVRPDGAGAVGERGGPGAVPGVGPDGAVRTGRADAPPPGLTAPSTFGMSPGAGLGTRVASDIGSSLGSGTMGAAVGAGLPADSDEERRRNALIGAGVGMVGGPLASRMMRRGEGALATPGASPGGPIRRSPPTVSGTPPPSAPRALPPGAGRSDDDLIAAAHRAVGVPERSPTLEPGRLERWRRDFVRAWTDNRVDLAEAQSEARRLLGRPLRGDEMMHELSRVNSSGVAKTAIDEHIRPLLTDLDSSRPVVTITDSAGKQIDMTEVQVLARLRELVNNRDIASAIGNPGRRFPGGLSAEESERAARSLFERLPEDIQIKIGQANNRVTDIIDLYRERMVDAGLWSRELADELKEKYPNWIPTKILDYMRDEGQPGASSIRSIGLSDRHLKQYLFEGTDKMREDGIASLIRYIQQAEDDIAKNRTFNAFVNLREGIPEWQGLVREVKSDTPVASMRGEKPVTGWVNGERKRFIVPEPLSAAIQMEQAPNVPVIGALGRTFRELVTRTPFFVAGQVPLDAASFIIRETSREGGPSPQNVARVVGALAGGYREAFRGLLDGTFHGDTAAYLKAGGGMAGYYQRSAQSASRALDDISRRSMLQIRNPDDLQKTAMWLLRQEPTVAVGQRVELAPRTASHRLGRERAIRRGMAEGADSQALVPAETAGASPGAPSRVTEGVDQLRADLEGMTGGRDVTLDFGRGGTWARILNQFVPFSNVGIQASVTPWRSFREKPSAYAATVGSLVGGPMLLAEAWNRGDPQRSRDYDDVPDYVKDRGIVVMTGQHWTDKQGNRHPYYALWQTRELSPFVIFSREMLGRTMKAAGIAPEVEPRAWQDVLQATATAASPVQANGAADLFSSATPLGASTGLQLGVNRDFFRDRDIATERGDEGAGVVAQAAAKATGTRASQWEFGMRDMTGNVGAALLAGADLGASLLGQVPQGTSPRSLERTPVVGSVASRFEGSAIGNRLQRAQIQMLTPTLKSALAQAGLREDQVPTVSNRVQNAQLRVEEQERWQRAFNAEVPQAVAQARASSKWAVIATRKDALRDALSDARERARQRALPGLTETELDQRVVREHQGAGR